MLIELHGKKACANALNRFVIGAFTKKLCRNGSKWATRDDTWGNLAFSSLFSHKHQARLHPNKASLWLTGLMIPYIGVVTPTEGVAEDSPSAIN